ncbi:hypothetical protein [Variovorax paradoxus]|uniref:hypothetical protein n=1 Tax=Variovorax paradoxus TaxID=34073 RepID=UPI00247FB37C|nr:hypothetical protein [Variovorax paradoxus]WGT65160.1 hypothetical protein QHG62_07400 [Variovorax paradoxus]
MLVYGDATRQEPAAQKLARLRSQLSHARASPAGIGRHGLLVDALIEAGELVQGVADARFLAAGRRDVQSPETHAAMALTMAVAGLCAHSWETGFSAMQPADEEGRAEEMLAAFEAVLPSIELRVKQPEGYAFYALYPEGHFVAAKRLRTRLEPWRVIGLRSIGTSLAAMAAVALEAPSPVTLRPVGHPFDRRVSLADAPLASPAAHHAIVDEGPGLSGSSMAGVIRRLRDEGVPADHIHLFPGHANGPGAQASDGTRALWRQAAAVHVMGFDELILNAAKPAHRLQGWVEALVGPLHSPLADVTGGGWRRGHDHASNEMPPAHPWQERRKFLARGNSGTWLVKFGGLGHAARQRFACAVKLAEAGFSPSVAGLCHGFMVERWHGEMAPLSPIRLQSAELRGRLIERLAGYIAFRARSFPASQESGASLQALYEMGHHNSGEALGSELAGAWMRYQGQAERLQGRVRRVKTDDRMHAWEWLAVEDRLLKTDAVDHHAGHDLVGCQDPAWDVAGAQVEFGLDADELAALLDGLSRRDCPIDVQLLRFYTPAYLAFQLGHYSMAAQDAHDPIEQTRLDAQCKRYTQALRRGLEEIA